MESATLAQTSSQTGPFARLRTVPASTWARAGFALLCLAMLVGYFVYPTYPNYDSYYSLLWGREFTHGDALSFEAYRAPTEHPLAILFGAALAVFGQDADRVLVVITLISFLLLVWGLYRLATLSFTPLVGVITAVLLCTRFDFPSLAARGYIDIPYLALVIWAAVLEARKPRCGTPVLLLLAAASLMRPEAWLLSGLYFLWVSWHADWPQRVRYAALAAIGPLAWVLVDYLVTGDLLFSLHATSGLAQELDRQKSAADIPGALAYNLTTMVKLPVVLAAVAGFGLAVTFTPKRMIMPLMLLVIGVGTFVLVGLGGLSVIPRYLLVAALAAMIFAAFALGGFTVLRRGSWVRRLWVAGSLLLVLFGVVFTATRIDLDRLDSDLTFRGDAHPELVNVLTAPGVKAGLRCGPISVPNHKLIPEVRWILDLKAGDVVARTDPADLRRTRRGVALYVTGRGSVFRQVFAGNEDSPLIQVPMTGFERVATSGFYAAYVRC